jgi:hypothetical protein
MWDGPQTDNDATTTVKASLVLATRLDGAAADFYRVIMGAERTIYAPTLDEFLKTAEHRTKAGGPISSSIDFVKPFDKPTLMPVWTDAAKQKFRTVTWWKGVGVGEWIYIFYCPINIRYEDWENTSNKGNFTPSAKRYHWRVATRVPRTWLDSGAKGPDNWDVRKSITDKAMEAVATKYTVPAALARIQQGIELLDHTARFIPGYAGAHDLAYGKSSWDRGMGAILIAADLVPMAGAVRNASKTVRVGSQSFVAIGAGARIVNGIKQTAEGQGNLGTGIDVGVAIIEGTVYALAHVNLKLRLRPGNKLDDSADLLRMLDASDGPNVRPIHVADDASAEKLAAFFKGKRTAADIKQRGLTPDELLELIESNPQAVKAKMAADVPPTGKKDGALDIPAILAALPDTKPYGRMATLAEYMRKRGVEVAWGDKGSKVLDALGEPDALGMFLVAPPAKPGGPARTALVFRGEPSGATVHHELWHRQDFIKNHNSSFDSWKAGQSIDKERYVHGRLTESRRWGEYGPKEKLNQKLYIEKLEKKEELEQLLKKLKDLGLDLK